MALCPPMPQNKIKCVWNKTSTINELIGIFSVVSPSHSLPQRDWYKLEKTHSCVERGKNKTEEGTGGWEVGRERQS